ncbi:MAG: hypothetical protein EA395_05250 [Phormidium sp. GEM2.Bin31]|nr:MAG: hypothetical protein EA395_05250 [Phormidium sp. GEM2.Bin31]
MAVRIKVANLIYRINGDVISINDLALSEDCVLTTATTVGNGIRITAIGRENLTQGLVVGIGGYAFGLDVDSEAH